MKKLIYLFLPLLILGGFIGFTGVSAQEAVVISQNEVSRHYKIGLIYGEEEGLQLDGYNIIVSDGDILPSEESQDYLAKLYSFTDEVLVESYFDSGEGGKFILKLPYYPTGKIIKIFDVDSQEILATNVQVFAKVCGDGECQGHESYESCQEDCLSGGQDDFCDKVTDEICDPDCRNIKDFDSDCDGENPATIAKEIREKAGLIEKQDNLSGGDESGVPNKNTQITSPNVGIFAIIIVVIIVIVSLLIFFLLKKEDK